MGKKLLVSLAMEGKFGREGLQSLDEDDDMLTAMARELVTENGVGEPAAAVWRQIQAENSGILNSEVVTPEPAHVDDGAPFASLVTPPVVVTSVTALKFGSHPPSVRPSARRREAPAVDEQLPLF
jgi:hypothetical protein